MTLKRWLLPIGFLGPLFARLHTQGGSAPPEECNQFLVDREVRVPYSAEYRFYADKS